MGAVMTTSVRSVTDVQCHNRNRLPGKKYGKVLAGRKSIASRHDSAWGCEPIVRSGPAGQEQIAVALSSDVCPTYLEPGFERARGIAVNKLYVDRPSVSR